MPSVYSPCQTSNRCAGSRHSVILSIPATSPARIDGGSMVGIETAVDQRLLVHAVRAQYSSSVQPLKQEAYDYSVSNTLFLHPLGHSLSAKKIQEAFARSSDGFNISLPEVRRSLQRLVQEGKVERDPDRHGELYRLTASEHERIRQLFLSADHDLQQIVSDVFQDDLGGSSQYTNCFLEILARALSRVGEESARLALNETVIKADADLDVLINEVRSSRNSYTQLDQTVLNTGV